MTTTAKKAAPKPGTKDYRPADGVCRHRNERLYDCANAVRPATETRKASVWCEAHIHAYADAKRSVKSATPAKAKASTAARDRRLAKANGGPLKVASVTHTRAATPELSRG